MDIFLQSNSRKYPSNEGSGNGYISYDIDEGPSNKDMFTLYHPIKKWLMYFYLPSDKGQ